MSILFSVVEGWTGLLGPFTLKVDSVAIPLTGFQVEIILRNGDVTPAGTVIVDPDQSTHPGQVSYQPDATDFVFDESGNRIRQSYPIHWKVTDGAGNIVFFPNGEADEISVYRA